MEKALFSLLCLFRVTRIDNKTPFYAIYRTKSRSSPGDLRSEKCSFSDP